MADRIFIWNAAYSAVTGDQLRNALDPGTGNPVDRKAGPIAAVYPSVVAHCLTAQAWPWTLKRERLTRRAAPDLRPEAYAYAMPPDAIGAGPRALFLDDGAYQPYDRHWVVEGDTIYTDAESLIAVYQYEAREPVWPEQFVEWVRLTICTRIGGIYTTPERVAEFIREAREVYDALVGSTAQTLAPRQLFERFETTAVRFGAGAYRPIQLADDGTAT